MPLYFAYGKNLDEKVLEERIGRTPCCWGAAFLFDHQITFNKIAKGKKMGWANAEECSTDVVWGVVWEITEADLKKLDSYEVGYSRKLMEVTICKSLKYGPGDAKAWVYFAKPKFVEYPRFPGLKYIDRIITAGEKYNFGLEYMKTLKRFREKAWRPEK